MKYFLSTLFLIITFLFLTYLCIIIIVNNKRVRKDLFYHYNYVPGTLLKTVRVHKLK
ncbi:ac110 [Palpita vitrealis nucleopolyhedrovirus]|uniref:Ac110 n=1 Tax=Palpita vitrealis nucleopolyhedrovirus TaxID=2951960 RepID=A0AAE9RYS0_9ABAC|nr:ac110 [Palpita vitrealis nucleopolyhedrovirus]